MRGLQRLQANINVRETRINFYGRKRENSDNFNKNNNDTNAVNSKNNKDSGNDVRSSSTP